MVNGYELQQIFFYLRFFYYYFISPSEYSFFEVDFKILDLNKLANTRCDNGYGVMYCS